MTTPNETTAPTDYWNRRALLFASSGHGLRAVCSYGMPGFYNRSIDWCQRLALRPYLRVAPGTRALDVGCGIGRWSRLLAKRSVSVLGVDHSRSMVEEATRRTRREGITGCDFQVADAAELDLGEDFDLILSVTVLQHVLDTERLERSVRNLARHLRAGGRLVLLEAAPTRQVSRCDTAVFRARTAQFYIRLFESRGLLLERVGGVDPMPLKTMLLPYYSKLPPILAKTALALVTALSLPVDAALGRWLPGPSWHKVLVFRKEDRR